jgi:hypothetical protein
LLKEFNDDERLKLLSSFSCPLNLDVEDFLLKKAARFQQSDKARTYLILSEETGVILAYFSLSFKELSLNNFEVSKKTVRKLDGINKHSEKIQSYLIGQIGKNDSIENNTLRLKDIMEIIWGIINEAQSLVGGRVVILECQNIEKLVNIYKAEGFTVLPSEDPETRLLTLYIVLSLK